MNELFIPAYISAGVSIYVAVYHFLLYLKKISPADNLSFSMLCLTVAAYDISCGGVYRSASVEEAVIWQRFSFIFVYGIGIAVVWFINYYIDLAMQKTAWAVTLLFSASILFVFFDDSILTLNADRHLVKDFTLFGMFRVRYYEAEPGIFISLSLVMLFLLFTFLIYRLYLYSRYVNRRKGVPLLFGMVMLFIAAISDSMVSTGVYNFIYLMEYFYAFLVLSVAYGLFNRLLELYNAEENLNLSLEKKIFERTIELREAVHKSEKINEALQKTNDELKRAERKAAADMKMAVNVQSALIQVPPPEVEGWDIDFFYRAKSQISGDFYDIYSEGRELKGLCLFDVSGHGVAAGLVTLLVKPIIARNFISGLDMPLNKIAAKINRDIIAEIKNIDQFLSGIILRFRGSLLEYVNAAHPNLMVRRAARGVTEKMFPSYGKIAKGSLLGLEEMDGVFDVIRSNIRRDDVLLLFSDGLSESINNSHEEFGEGRIIQALQSAGNGSAKQILDYVYNEFEKFISPGAPGDDITIIALKRLN